MSTPETMPLLAGIDDVRWAALRHAYGSAVDVPELLRALAAPGSAAAPIVAAAERNGRGVREEVFERLDSTLFHQGDRYSATPKAVPFLAELLRDGPDEQELQAYLLGYLRHLAFGYPEESFPSPRFLLSGPASDADADLDDTYDHPVERGHARECFVAVEAELSAFERFVLSPLERVALPAIGLLASFPERATRSCEVLRVVIADDSLRLRPLRAACSLVARAHLGDASVQSEAEARLDQRDQNAVIHAACASVLANPKDVSARALGVLREVRGKIAEAPSPFTNFVGTLARRCLRCVPSDRF